jgi:hypothetical protein
METLPLTFVLPGLPATFGTSFATLGFSTSHTVTGPTNGTIYVVQGIDYSAGPTAGEAAGFYDINGTGQVYTWSETIDLSSPRIAYPGSWRGAILLGAGATLTYGVESALPAGLGCAAWGVVVPAPPGFIS